MWKNFRFKTFRRADYWGIGFEASVQYSFNEDHTVKTPTGFALIVCLITREFRLGYFWG